MRPGLGWAALGLSLLGCGTSSLAGTPTQEASVQNTGKVEIDSIVQPEWVLRYVLPAGPLPPADECATVPKVESPGVERAPTPPTHEPSPPPETSGMVRVDVGVTAENAALPDPIRMRLGFGAPFDVTTIAPEPLRGRPEDLERVGRVLAQAAEKQGTTRISFWGASHVAGEYLTGELRRLLQDRYGDAGHGFVMPAAPWKGYRATDVNLCAGGEWTSDFHQRSGGRRDGLLGPAGVSVEALAPTSFGWVQTTRTNPHGRAVSRFEVLFLRQPGGGALDVQIDGVDPIRVSTAGPQGPGAAVFALEDGPHRLGIAPAGDGPVRVFGAHIERDTPGVIVDAMGVSGRTAASWLAWDEPLQAAYLARRRVDLAVLAYGTNEANDRAMSETEYRATLEKVLTRMRRVLPSAACVLIGPSDRARKVSGNTYAIWDRTAWVAQVQRDLGPAFGCVTWDLQEATGGPGSMVRWRSATPALGADDYIHFTAAGYRELANRLLVALDGA